MLNDIINIIGALPSQHVIFGLISTTLCFAVAWVYGNSARKGKIIIIRTIGYLVLFNEILFQLYMVYYNIWSIKTSLPLEMCYLSALLIPVYANNLENRDLKNWFFFAGFGGSLFAFINTNLSEQEHIYVSIHYFFAHGLVIFVMLSIVIDGYLPKWTDYFNAIKWTTVLVASIILINVLIGSNYMFTFLKPEGVNFTQLMPEWPYYFLIMLLIGLVFYTFMMVVTIIIKTYE
ncbi:MAG: TIGR02206 family membrane protein [Candidatus Marinimicrobia bacterium]|nr:TIGR02206 family membrane protein [Candidatus Neomarinimicrobiota bacterium]